GQRTFGGLTQALRHALLLAQQFRAAAGHVGEGVLQVGELLLGDFVARFLQLALGFLGGALHFLGAEVAGHGLLGLVHGADGAFHAALQFALGQLFLLLAFTLFAALLACLLLRVTGLAALRGLATLAGQTLLALLPLLALLTLLPLLALLSLLPLLTLLSLLLAVAAQLLALHLLELFLQALGLATQHFLLVALRLGQLLLVAQVA